MQPHAYLLDALLVLDEQLNTRNVDVEPRPLRGALHWSVDAAIVLAAHTHTESQTIRPVPLRSVSQTTRLHRSQRNWSLPDKHLSQALGVCRKTASQLDHSQL